MMLFMCHFGNGTTIGKKKKDQWLPRAGGDERG